MRLQKNGVPNKECMGECIVFVQIEINRIEKWFQWLCFHLKHPLYSAGETITGKIRILTVRVVIALTGAHAPHARAATRAHAPHARAATRAHPRAGRIAPVEIHVVHIMQEEIVLGGLHHRHIHRRGHRWHHRHATKISVEKTPLLQVAVHS